MAGETQAQPTGKGGTIVIAIVVPSVFVIILIILIVTRAFILPRLGRGHDDFAIVKEQRMKQRLEEIDQIIKSQNYYEWLATQKEQESRSLIAADPLCAICLDDFVEDAQIRGLRCSHAFHAHCLDEWFSRFNEYCPLCHRTIIPGRRAARKKMMERPDPIPVTFMV
ncbi:hypothetical protein CC86DRAFT_333315 [Ophiobolus disseminans]|uniref:RING-type domain-containing protein n=1 Tax=Ophiobolus disseminans TaxID=1469910 RepID=A0A6A6ZKF5_9PLEO|nr:hypothetical protein CC86DRAFT_333315 [Ophiobolus disseminans]